ncbi:MAG: hypothetical protein K9J16_07850 [Melioribacteraceae bacterium]|nr:hypothetical protein [Melioribacteraceae bacterium]MCF8353344.1 hypothetical protein [Melioribacteraceae bacterium]MCF8393208.1 hypothetical protein [Melioribacteraceae bacterium]MCF8419070.1 hypothetical protein [Melioribacteraceae bacterium]
MSLFQNHAGIHLTGRKIELIEIIFDSKNFILENVDEQIFDEPLSNEITDSQFISILQNAYNKITVRKSLESVQVSFSLSNRFFKVFEVPYEETLTEQDLREHMHWELDQNFPQNKNDDYAVQYIPLEKSILRKFSKAVVVAVDKKILKKVHAFCVHNNLELKLVDNAHLSANLTLHMQKDFDESKVTLTLLLEDGYLSASLMENSYPVYFTTLEVREESDTTHELLRMKEQMDRLKINTQYIEQVILFSDFNESLYKAAQNVFGIEPVKFDPYNSIEKNETIPGKGLINEADKNFYSSLGIAIRLI